MPATHLLSVALWMADSGDYESAHSLRADLQGRFQQRHLTHVFEAEDMRACVTQRCQNALARQRRKR